MSIPGIDIVEIDRLINVKDSFVKHVLTESEQEVFYSYKENRRIEYLAGRFAAKEAIIKCLSDYELPDMRNIEILNNKKGKPVVKYKDYNILVSISHEKHYAVALAILQEEK